MVAKKAPQKQSVPKQDIPSIQVRIDNMVDYEGSRVKAFASINLGGHFAIHGFKVCQSDDGRMSVLCPATKNQKNGKYYEDAHPITAEARAALKEAILNAYEEQLGMDEDQTEEQDESADEVQTM